MITKAAERGFTLVEMLVALVIFAVLASAGVGLLRTSVDTQQAVSGALADLGTAARMRVLLGNDLGQAVVRPITGARRGFAGDRQYFLMVRTIDSEERGESAAGLQAVRWSLEGDRLLRTAVTSDGTPIGGGIVLARDVRQFAIRFRTRSGTWLNAWTGLAPEPALPAALELWIERAGEAPVSLVVALPEGPRLPAAELTGGLTS